jgi:hypothetical protein
MEPSFFIGNICLHIGRSYHLGCPVGFGNKWIANKWVKWTGQVIHGTLTRGDRGGTMGQHALKNVNNCLNTNIYSYIETTGGQSSILNLNVVHFFNTSVN